MAWSESRIWIHNFLRRPTDYVPVFCQLAIANPEYLSDRDFWSIWTRRIAGVYENEVTLSDGTKYLPFHQQRAGTTG
jgi:hypothetical protein